MSTSPSSALTGLQRWYPCAAATQGRGRQGRQRWSACGLHFSKPHGDGVVVGGLKLLDGVTDIFRPKEDRKRKRYRYENMSTNNTLSNASQNQATLLIEGPSSIVHCRTKQHCSL